jgi:N-acetylated-alpha-linked acidic dipeptidase
MVRTNEYSNIKSFIEPFIHSSHSHMWYDLQGYCKGSVFPDGPWRPASGVQRGSIYIGPGDPSTPGWASVPGAPRIDLRADPDPESEFPPLPRIPSQPISWQDAYPILNLLGGTPSPEKWHGCLNVSYAIGPGPVEAHLNLRFNYTYYPIWNVIGKIPGVVEPENLVIIGNVSLTKSTFNFNFNFNFFF